MIEITIEEYAKLVSDVKAYEIGFTITISLLAAIISALVIHLFIKECIKEDK